MHLKVNCELEKIKRDGLMGLVMTRNKVSRDCWLLEALIVCLELYRSQQSQAPANTNFITRSDGMRCAVRELRGMSEVRISDSAPAPGPPQLSSTAEKPSLASRDSSRDSSCPPASSSGWRSRLVREEQEQLQERRRKKEMEEEEEEKRKAAEIQERKVIRVRRTSERRKRLDTINSESDYSVSSPSLSLPGEKIIEILNMSSEISSFIRFRRPLINLHDEEKRKRREELCPPTVPPQGCLLPRKVWCWPPQRQD